MAIVSTLWITLCRPVDVGDHARVHGPWDARAFEACRLLRADGGQGRRHRLGLELGAERVGIQTRLVQVVVATVVVCHRRVAGRDLLDARRRRAVGRAGSDLPAATSAIIRRLNIGCLLTRFHAADAQDRKSTRLNSSHVSESRMPSSA